MKLVWMMILILVSITAYPQKSLEEQHVMQTKNANIKGKKLEEKISKYMVNRKVIYCGDINVLINNNKFTASDYEYIQNLHVIVDDYIYKFDKSYELNTVLHYELKKTKNGWEGFTIDPISLNSYFYDVIEESQPNKFTLYRRNSPKQDVVGKKITKIPCTVLNPYKVFVDPVMLGM